MTISISRRQFTQTSAAMLAGAANFGLLGRLPAVSAADATPDSDKVRFSSDIEPLVRLIEDTPREKLLEEMAQRIKRGTSYREVLSALLLAGVRSIQPHPIGFRFHCVLVVNSAHLASLASPDEYRWFPMFWSLDEFKYSQAEMHKKQVWAMPTVKSTLPADKARQALTDAMESWDESAADAAIASLARTATQQEIYELLYRYGARDFYNISHKPIYVANSQRTLQCIGRQNAEPLLRSLVMGLLDYTGNKSPATTETATLRPYLANVPRLPTFPANWRTGRVDSGATSDLLAAMRQAPSEEIGRQVVEMLGRGIAPRSIWDAAFVGASELMARERAIVGIHAVTAVNALHYAYEATGNDETRRLLLLQGTSLIPFMREEAMRRRRDDALPEFRMDTLEPLAPKGTQVEATAEILSDTSGDKTTAVRKLLGYLQDHPAEPWIDAARLLIFSKGNDVHDYKLSSALFEDYFAISPEWRARYLAASPFRLHGSRDKDNDLARRTREALA